MVCVVCDGAIDPAWWRWVCPGCGATLHYACVPGGVPVRGPEQLRCECGAGLVAHDRHEDPDQPALF